MCVTESLQRQQQKDPLKPYPCPGRTEDFSRLLDHNRQKEWIDVCYILPNTASLYVPKTTRKPKGLKEARKEGRGGARWEILIGSSEGVIHLIATAMDSIQDTNNTS